MIADDLSRIAMSSNLSATLARGADYAHQNGHFEVRLEHMLLSLCEDPDAALVLAASNIDVGQLSSEVVNFLASLDQMPPGQNATPGVSADLRRILDAATAAARGGRRREINGAIVLAAIVGDGKSAAAHLLRDQGLTFEGAIKALQGASKATPQGGRSGGTNAEDIIADARARVQSRTGPPRHEVHEEPDDDEADEEPEEAGPAPVPALAPPRPAPAENAQQTPPRQQQPEPPAQPRPPQPQIQPQPQPQPASRERLAERLQRPHETTQGSRPSLSQKIDAARDAHSAQWPEHPPRYEDEGGISSLDDDMDAYEVEEEAGPPPGMPASAPFPPPLPVPEASWTPPPGADHMQPPPPPPLPAPGESFGRVPPLHGESMMPSPAPEVPWAHPGEMRGPPPVDQAHAAGQAGGGPVPARARGAPPPGSARPPAQGNYGRSGPTPRAEIGQLVENIPRIMRVAISALVEVRIARADVRSLAEGLQGGGAAYHHQVSITKAMSVRLRAPDGGFFIETASPETQWIEKSALISGEDYASWRWHVTPRDKGRKRLQLVISARTVGPDGLTAETALPDQVITVRVRTNYAKSVIRWSGWVAAAIVGGLLARFGEGAFDAGKEFLAKLLAS